MNPRRRNTYRDVAQGARRHPSDAEVVPRRPYPDRDGYGDVPSNGGGSQYVVTNVPDDDGVTYVNGPCVVTQSLPSAVPVVPKVDPNQALKDEIDKFKVEIEFLKMQASVRESLNERGDAPKSRVSISKMDMIRFFFQYSSLSSSVNHKGIYQIGYLHLLSYVFFIGACYFNLCTLLGWEGFDWLLMPFLVLYFYRSGWPVVLVRTGTMDVAADIRELASSNACDVELLSYCVKQMGLVPRNTLTSRECKLKADQWIKVHRRNWSELQTLDQIIKVTRLSMESSIFEDICFSSWGVGDSLTNMLDITKWFKNGELPGGGFMPTQSK
jgi:hypothetical protein